MLKKIKSFLPEKLPNLKQSRFFLKTLNKKERSIFLIVLVFFFISFISGSAIFYFKNTQLIPTSGGKYIEGIIGSPRFLNPIYSSANDVDRDITSLLFSGLMKYDSESEKMIPNIVESIEKDGRFFTITLKNNLRWSDGERLTAEDLIFTVKTIQNPDYRSPLRPDWTGIKTEKKSDFIVRFELEQESLAFLNKLSLRIIPHHIWKDISPQNFPLSFYNLNAVGSGPYRIREVYENQEGKIDLINLEINPYYHGKKPYIEEISFKFFDNKDDLIRSAKRKEIHGFSIINPQNYKELVKETRFLVHRYQLPRYFALFFNLEGSDLLKDVQIRKAINYAINKEEIIKEVLSGRGEIINSPIPSFIYKIDLENHYEFNFEKANQIFDDLGFIKNEEGFREKIIQEKYNFTFEKDLSLSSQGEDVRELQKCLMFLTKENPEIFPDGRATGFYGTETRDAVSRLQEKYKEEILQPSGFSKGTGMVAESTRLKLNEICKEIPEQTSELSITISTVDQELMIETAESIQKQLKKVGIRVFIELHDRGNLERDVIKPRNYEALLFGKALEFIPDPFPFWHSSQKTEFGLNLTMYKNEKVDELLENIRKEIDQNKQNEKLKEFQKIIIEDSPAVFLYNPDYLFFLSPRIKGITSGKIINPSDRFSSINNWYFQTQRIWIKK